MPPNPLDAAAPLVDEATISAFVDALFRYAEGSFVSLRAFGDHAEKNASIPIVKGVELSRGLDALAAEAASVARDAARRPQPYVFCPPKER